MDYPISFHSKKKSIHSGLNPNKIRVNHRLEHSNSCSKCHKRLRTGLEEDLRFSRSGQMKSSAAETHSDLVDNGASNNDQVINFFDILFDITSASISSLKCQSFADHLVNDFFGNKNNEICDKINQIETYIDANELSSVMKKLSVWYATEERARLATVFGRFGCDLLTHICRNIRRRVTKSRSPLSREYLLNSIANEEEDEEEEEVRPKCFTVEKSKNRSHSTQSLFWTFDFIKFLTNHLIVI